MMIRQGECPDCSRKLPPIPYRYGGLGCVHSAQEQDLARELAPSGYWCWAHLLTLFTGWIGRGSLFRSVS